AGEDFGAERCKILTRVMRELHKRDLPFTVRRISVDEARELLEGLGLMDKLELLRTHWETSLRVVSLEQVIDLFHASVCYSTGAVRAFKLEPYEGGFILRLPVRGSARVEGRLKVSRTIFSAHRETRSWNERVGVANLGHLNRLTVSGGIEELIRMAESYHEKKIAAIAERIAHARRRPRLVLVAGPSSSGKTTFVKRLSIQLRVLGIWPLALSVDNFFVPREKTPRDSRGEYDFECLEALDLRLFNKVLTDLLQKGAARVPRYDFHMGRPIDRKDWDEFSLQPHQVVLVEGIHALNPLLTPAVSARDKFRIYISALTQLSIDDDNRIFTSDTRLLRRIVRDRRYRGYSAAETVKRWPMVRQGERRHIFPFQDQADVMFNSALIYEHAVLRNYAERFLLEVDVGDPTFAEVYRLLGFLRLVVPTPPDAVPQTSLLREFIGGSGFSYNSH
ncbi:MAG: nucleoside kinase, partial [Polyangia bacterium]|nr:nucleoside kinase [Polyangia bacterium]